MTYGKDPNLMTPTRVWPLTLSQAERALVSSLSDLILPLPSGYPAPSQIGIDDFFDEWISAPYPQQMGDRKVIIKGISIIDAEAVKRFAQPFISLGEENKKTIIDGVLTSTVAIDDGVVFFKRFRYLLVGAYYTSDHGFEAIGYKGNIPLSSFPRVSEEASELIREELKRLGLPYSK